MRRLLGVLAAALVVALPFAASAQVAGAPTKSFESSRDFVIEVNGGYFTPKIDSESGLHGSPYRDIFGKKGMLIFGGELDWSLWRGFAADFASVSGHGIVVSTGEAAPDSTSFKTVPLRVLGVYRFDWLARRWNIPLVPFGKVGLAHTLWWITDGKGDVAKFESDDGTATGKAWGGKWGYELAGGIALELNFLDPTLSREFDDDFGVNSVYLHAQYLRIADFKSQGLDVGTRTFQFGLGFEF